MPTRVFRSRFLSAAAILLALILAAPSTSFSDVTGTVPSGTLMSTQQGTYSLSLVSDTDLGAINGELTYDPALLTSPSVVTGAGAAGFTAMGNELSAGVYRFVLYNDDPGAVLNLASPVLDFSFAGVAGLDYADIAEVNFTIEAAAYLDSGSGNAISVGQGGPGGTPAAALVDFQPFELLVTRFNDNPIDNAIYVSTTAPPQVSAGGSYIIGVTFQNTGTTWWEDLTGYWLEVVGDTCPLIEPVLSGIGIPGGIPAVVPAATQQFQFRIVAPVTTGPCQIQLRMARAGAGMFGQTATINIDVVETANPVTDWDLYQ